MFSKAARPVALRVAQTAAKRAVSKAVAPNHLASLQAMDANMLSGLVNSPARSFFSTAPTSDVPAISESEVKGLFSLWNDALATLEPEKVAARYASKTVLLPTVSDLPRTDKAGLVDYFTDFLQKKPQGVILESNVIQGDEWCMDAGIYEFTMGATGDKVKARYTYVYTYEEGEWKIAHHHSSVMPEAFLG